MKKKAMAWLLTAAMGISTFAGCPALAMAEETQEPVTITLWWPGSGDAYENLAGQLADLVHETYD